LRERKRELWLRKWEPKPDEELDEHIQYVKRIAARYISWGDIGQLWNASARDEVETEVRGDEPDDEPRDAAQLCHLSQRRNG
jgi:hypothetical protein